MYLGRRLGHLAYSMLVHPGDTWPEMRESLETYAPAVKARVSPNDAYGVSLRLSASSVETLTADPEERQRLRRWLDDRDMYVYTVNAFPYGPFKGDLVKEKVYEPDWTTEDRLRYTIGVAEILAEITGPDVEPSIQTAPLAFRPNVTGEGYVADFTDNLLRAVAFLMELERRTGRRVKLALEPEPFCFLETIADVVGYFETSVYSAPAARRLGELSGEPLSEVHGALRRHLGVVFDICHQSVAFEDIEADLDVLAAAGIPVFKLQAAAALLIPEVTPAIVEELRKYTGTIYLSQTTELRGEQLTRFLNLEDAIAAWESDPGPREWRTHFHVPVFLEDLGPFRTTRSGIDAAMAAHVKAPVSTHLEIETYTWDVLPEHLKSGDITEYVVRELDYVRGVLSRT